MGGDGTFAEVAKGMLASQHAREVAMGMLPTGTANDQGKSFGLAAGPGALERNVARGRRRLDGRLRCRRGSRSSAGSRRSTAICSSTRSRSASAPRASPTRNRDRELVGRIPGLGLIYRNQLVYVGAVARRFAESYVVDIKFDLDAVIDGARASVPSRCST